MAKQLKKASLLSEAERQKLLKKAGNKKPIIQTQTTAATSFTRSTQRSSAIVANEDKTNKPSAKKAKIFLSIAVMFIAAFVLAPKPQLLEYQSAGLTTKSIYMPGWFGKPGIIMDTNQRAVLAEDENTLYLCFEGQTNEQCAKYQLKQQQGFVAAALFWNSTRR